MSADLTIDELARQADTKTSTVRMYQTKGLLDPPEVRGRVGYYSAAHVGRLRAIGSLQQRGYSLAAIKELFDGYRRGARLDQLLGIKQGRPPARLDPAEFMALFPDGTIDLEVVTRAVDLGLIEVSPSGTEIRAPSPTFVEVGRALAGYGVPPAVALDEFEALTADTRRIADRYVALFERYVVGDDPTLDRIAQLAPAIERFRGLAVEAVGEALERAMDEAAAEAATRLRSAHDDQDAAGR
ncbi:MerR family transcriptional regulator [Pseudonocardia sp. TRM90224]|uniref:MerR family transcriptional regulator n=1 Tax=Pseudonocardia sp. TRM90224 TaxID=2812678 RepID=UPI001E4433BD|nr:MerR family transcriptional regulator [Pseudonocardia sp. TRM90224]